MFFPGTAMTVICDVCRASNRDKAMFCAGCARKLQAFRANGPSMLSSLDTSAWRRPGSDGGRADRPPRSAGSPSRCAIARSWLAGAMLIATGLVAAMAWNGLSNALPHQPTSRAVDLSSTIDIPRSIPPDQASPTHAAAATPPVPVQRFSEDPPPREPAVAPGRPATGSGPRSRQAQPVRRPAAPGAGAITGADSSIDDPRAPRDPRLGCQHLFFAFAARCTANHCLEAASAGHPHCEQVRAETRRDVARRDMTSN